MTLNLHNVRLEAMAAHADQYPEPPLPEIALAGRSNVGKSTLINCLLQRKKLAYTSASPGKTRTVNFYNVDEQLRIVDLPGYGFAKASKQAQAEWAKSIEEYLQTRETLREVILLCDLRHEPTALDRQMYDWILEAGFSGIIIGTKADKLPRTKVLAHAALIRKALGAKDPSLILPYSGSDKTGLESVFERIMGIAGIDVEDIKR